ncbi:hypothetical protein HLB15_08495, partial [Promicromonospora citrea]|nr:hypothetical protein [Promicromonospora citrea]
ALAEAGRRDAEERFGAARYRADLRTVLLGAGAAPGGRKSGLKDPTTA